MAIQKIWGIKNILGEIVKLKIYCKSLFTAIRPI